MSKHFKCQTLIKIKSLNNNLPYFWQATSHQVEGEQVSGTSSSLPPQHCHLTGPHVKTALKSDVSLRMKSQFK